ncbi:hypothetical protein Q5H93_14935 [Hymenobacter sp. ASUV-10]|uniref:Uncharacterized protein n=1 Tax=Hymenobacter aranciens TaxID=3063996 RepID=A0ABT9BCQ3_9BACT|nr:hypothetical protein [Hymenobacter sp. ASUV-10]MDO7876037.1 hypothetical protein [Hymenobacter sp. ASUV-10]
MLLASASALGAQPPLWPFQRTETARAFSGVFIVTHQYRSFGRTSRFVGVRGCNLVSRKSWGLRTKTAYTVHGANGRRLSPRHYTRAVATADERVVVTHRAHRTVVMEYLDAAGRLTPYTQN